VDAALIPPLERDPLRDQGIELRRIIWFIRSPPPATTPGAFTTAEGTAVKMGSLDSERSVVAKKHVTSSRTGDRKGYSIEYSGPDAQDASWLQMLWRDAMLLFFPSGGAKERRTAVRQRVDHLATMDMPYFLSTDPDRATKPEVCRWHADAPTTKSPFFDAFIKRSGSGLFMFDAPSPTMSVDKAKALFASASPPDSIESGFHAETFLVRGMDVLYRVKVD